MEDNVKQIVTKNDFNKEEGTALYLDKKYYSCVVLSESGTYRPSENNLIFSLIYNTEYSFQSVFYVYNQQFPFEVVACELMTTDTFLIIYL